MRGTLARVCGLLWMVSVMAACANLAVPTAVPVLDEAALANGRYSVSIVPGRFFELVDGEGVLLAGQGSEAGATLSLLAVPRARGDINGDGSEDVAAILSVTKPGAAESFELVLVLNQAGQPQQAASAALGEGIEVDGVTIDRGQVMVATLGRPPGASSATQPSRVRVWTFAYQGQALVEGPATEVAMSSVTGTLTYRERVALPPGAIVSVQLVDITQPNAPAILISEQSFASQGSQVPLAFVLAFAPAAIDERNAYALQAAIAVEGKLLFRTTQQYLVITHGEPATIDIILERVG